MTRTRPWSLAFGALSLLVAVEAAAQSGTQYDIIKDEYGNVVGEIGGNGISTDADMQGVWGYVTCPNNGIPTVATGCPGSVATPISVYVSKTKLTSATLPSLAARTPPAASKCSAGWWPVYIADAWTCKLKTKTGVVKTRINQ